jgi:monovalent cation:H+ antiporter-2, CPA2 family
LGINVVAIRRSGKTITEIRAEEKLKLGDVVYVVGRPEALEEFEAQVEIE